MIRRIKMSQSLETVPLGVRKWSYLSDDLAGCLAKIIWRNSYAYWNGPSVKILMAANSWLYSLELQAGLNLNSNKPGNGSRCSIMVIAWQIRGKQSKFAIHVVIWQFQSWQAYSHSHSHGRRHIKENILCILQYHMEIPVSIIWNFKWLFVSLSCSDLGHIGSINRQLKLVQGAACCPIGKEHLIYACNTRPHSIKVGTINDIVTKKHRAL